MKIKTILVDDEILAMKLFELECAEFEDIEILEKFDSPIKAVQYVESHEVDVAVLDIEMPEMNGIELGKKLKAKKKDIILIFITAHQQYAMNAYQLHSPVYLEKPYSHSDLLYALNMVRLMIKNKNKSIFIRTFGYFDVFINETPIYFSNKKSKELLAYLVDRMGNSVNNEQIINVLWEDACNEDRYQSRFRRVLKDLRDTLDHYNIKEILIERPNFRAVDTKKIDCDLYQWLNESTHKRQGFNGNYMTEYSWAEETLGYLMRQ